MTTPLTDLLRPHTAQDEEASLLSVLKSVGFPTADWATDPQNAGVLLSRAIAASLAAASANIPAVAAGGHAFLAAELSDPAWLDLHGEGLYNLRRARATYTKQLCAIHVDEGFGPVTINPGFTARAQGTKNVYSYQGAPVTIEDNSTADLEFTAGSTGSMFADPVNTLTEVVTSLPGVSINNPARPFGRLSGPGASSNAANRGSGSVVPSGTPTLARIFSIIVTGTGSVGISGSVRIEWQQDDTISSVTLSPIPSSYLVGDGVTLTFADGVGAGFLREDRHAFETLASAITANGVDDESNKSYVARISGRWPSMGRNIVASKYETWVRECSIENALGIEKVTVSASVTVAGQTDITIATATGSPAGPMLRTVQEFLNARTGHADTASVAGAVNVPIRLAGNVFVKAAEAAEAKAAADDAWRAYVSLLPIGGDLAMGFPGVLRLSDLTHVLMDAGAIDVSGITVNGAAANLALALDRVAVIPAGQAPSTALTWISV